LGTSYLKLGEPALADHFYDLALNDHPFPDKALLEILSQLKHQGHLQLVQKYDMVAKSRFPQEWLKTTAW